MNGNLKISSIIPLTGKKVDALEEKLAAILKRHGASYEVYAAPIIASANKYWAIYYVRYDNAPKKALKELRDFCVKNKLSI